MMTANQQATAKAANEGIETAQVNCGEQSVSRVAKHSDGKHHGNDDSQTNKATMKEHECTKGGLSNVMSNQRGSWMQCAKPLGRASVGESVTGIPRGVRERDRARGDNCTNNVSHLFCYKKKRNGTYYRF